MDLNLISVALYSYLLGSLPFGLILTKIFLHKDIRKVGSGNIGTTNVLRTGNKFLALTTLLLDLLKGFVSVFITLLYFESLVSYSALICFIGHIYPVWLKFKGGKGVATYIGFLFGFNPYIAILFLLVWVVTAFVSKYSSLRSLIGILVAPAYYIFINFNFYILIFFIYLTLIIYLKHTENIKRLINKTESKIKLSK